jgi:ubiquinone/menaquinone biosynthesis C-methylase UbiE
LARLVPNPERAVPEIARVLGDGGRLGVVWTSRDRREDDANSANIRPARRLTIEATVNL